MIDRSTILLGILIVLVFIWRFARTRQLYLSSLEVKTLGVEPVNFNPGDIHCIIHQGLLGQRSVEPKSFFIRGIVLAVISLCLLPFKHYQPALVWLVIGLIALYIPFCVIHGLMLKRQDPRPDVLSS